MSWMQEAPTLLLTSNLKVGSPLFGLCVAKNCRQWFHEDWHAEVRRVQDAVARGDMSWCQKDIDSLREPFPEGHAGSFIEGQEIDCMIEGAGGRGWCPRPCAR